jgi:hypothetical protein
VLLTEAFLQINIKLFGLNLITTAFCGLLFWALPQGSGFSLQSFLKQKSFKKGFPLQPLTQLLQ